MSIITTVEFPLQPGKRDEFVDLLVEALKATRKTTFSFMVLIEDRDPLGVSFEMTAISI